MKTRRNNSFNLKRRLIHLDSDEKRQLPELIEKVRYGGNPEHKKNPGDFGLTPPMAPRPGKALCDVAGIFRRRDALALLKEGIRSDCVSDRFEKGWPKNVWAVTGCNLVLESQLENPQTGSYHSYPLPGNDPMAAEVLARWKRRKND